MNVQHLPPNNAVAAYVNRLLVIDNYRIVAPFSLPLFANGTPTLVFLSKKGIINQHSTGNLLLFGQTIAPEILTLTEDFTLIAYFFKPFALYSLFGVAAEELTDKIIDLNLLAPQITLALQEQLLNAADAPAMCMLLDNYLVKLIAGSKLNNNLVQYATEKIVANPTKEILVQVQQELNITERTFQRAFEKNVGIAPNLYRRICQFNNAFQQLNNNRNNKLTDIALRNGYADQSHFIRTFKAFTHFTPTAYLDY